MKISQLKALVRRGESELLEFKKSTGSISTGMQAVCAFLNSEQGGTVIFGVNDEGKIIGQDVADSTRKLVATELKKFEPHAPIEVEYVSVKGARQALVLQVKAGEKAPYTYDGRAYVRNQSTTSYMSKEEYVYLHNHNNPTQWESLTNNECKLRDLDHAKIKEVVRMAIFEKRLPGTSASAGIPSILRKLGLMVGGKLTNAAVILFCKNQDKQLMQSNVKLARFKGLDKNEFLDTKAFCANAFELYDKTMDFLSFTLPVAARIEPGNPTRVETPAIPYSVLREAVTNALVHRDYSHAGGSMFVAVYDNRVNITNMGALPKGLVLKQLSREHPSVQRNPLIANVFYLCGKIEKWGRGTLGMIQECKKVDNPTPKYEEVGGNFSITLPFKRVIAGTTARREEPIGLNEITSRQKKILEILKKGPISRRDMVILVGAEVPERTLQLELTKLKKMGLIKSEGKARASLWLLV